MENCPFEEWRIVHLMSRKLSSSRVENRPFQESNRWSFGKWIIVHLESEELVCLYSVAPNTLAASILQRCSLVLEQVGLVILQRLQELTCFLYFLSVCWPGTSSGSVSCPHGERDCYGATTQQSCLHQQHQVMRKDGLRSVLDRPRPPGRCGFKCEWRPAFIGGG